MWNPFGNKQQTPANPAGPEMEGPGSSPAVPANTEGPSKPELSTQPPAPVTEIPWKSVSPDIPQGAITDNGVNLGSSKVEGGSPITQPTATSTPELKVIKPVSSTPNIPSEGIPVPQEQEAA